MLFTAKKTKTWIWVAIACELLYLLGMGLLISWFAMLEGVWAKGGWRHMWFFRIAEMVWNTVLTFSVFYLLLGDRTVTILQLIALLSLVSLICSLYRLYHIHRDEAMMVCPTYRGMDRL